MFVFSKNYPQFLKLGILSFLLKMSDDTVVKVL